MKKSSDRILTSHAGSLPRPDDLIAANAEREAGKADEATFQAKLRQGVADVVRRQVEAGISVPGDGEYGKSMGSQGQLPRLVELFLHAAGRTEDRGHRSRHTAGPPVDAGQHRCCRPSPTGATAQRFAAAYGDPEFGNNDGPARR